MGVIILTFLLASKFTKDESIGLWSSFLVVISPWFFIFSRTGYEATAGLMFYLLGIYLFLKYLGNRWSILFLTVSFILSAYSYNSFRIILPLTIIPLILFGGSSLRQILTKQKAAISISIILLILTVIPIYRLFVYDTGGVRLKAIGNSSKLIFSSYISHFNPEFLFISGDKNLRSQQAGFGQFNLVEIILFPLGLLYIRKLKNRNLLLSLILISPIPAAITKEFPHALRAVSLVPFFIIISAMGVTEIKKYIKQKYLVEIAVTIISSIFFTSYFINFVNVYPSQSSKDWQFGYKRIYQDYASRFSTYDQIVISDQYAQPYIFGLYYLRYNPNKFRQEVVRNSIDQWGFSLVKGFNKFIFEKITFDSLPKGKSLIFATPIDQLTEILPKELILNLDNSISFYVYEYNKK